MPDVPEQLRDWSQSLADSVASTDFETVTAPRDRDVRRRWLAVAASVVFVVAGIVAAATLSGRGSDRISPVTEAPRPTDGAASTSTAPEPPRTTAPTQTTGPLTTTPTPNDGEFDIASVFGDLGAEALAVTSDGRVAAAADTRLLLRDPDGEVTTIQLPDGIVVSQAWVGTDEIAVTWGADSGAEVDLRTSQVVTILTRSNDIWTRTELSPADSYSINAGRPTNPLGLGLLIDAATQLPTVEGAGGFEVIYDQSQQWTIARPAEGSAAVDEITPLPDGAYLVTMQSVADPTIPADIYPFVLRSDGSIESLDPVTANARRVDAQPGPDGITVLITHASGATIESIMIPDTT